MHLHLLAPAFIFPAKVVSVHISQITDIIRDSLIKPYYIEYRGKERERERKRERNRERERDRERERERTGVIDQKQTPPITSSSCQYKPYH